MALLSILCFALLAFCDCRRVMTKPSTHRVEKQQGPEEDEDDGSWDFMDFMGYEEEEDEGQQDPKIVLNQWMEPQENLVKDIGVLFSETQARIGSCEEVGCPKLGDIKWNATRQICSSLDEFLRLLQMTEKKQALSELGMHDLESLRSVLGDEHGDFPWDSITSDRHLLLQAVEVVNLCKSEYNACLADCNTRLHNLKEYVLGHQDQASQAARIATITDKVENRIFAKYKEYKASEYEDVVLFLNLQNTQFHGEAKPLVEVSAKAGDLVFVIGDLHGRLDQLLYVMQKIKQIVGDARPELPNPSRWLICTPGVYYVFLGDYVDRAPNDRSDVSTALAVLLYRWLCPRRSTHGVLLLRGNHEDLKINKQYGFTGQRGDKEEGAMTILVDMNDDTADAKLSGLETLFGNAWQTLPIAAAFNQKALFVHGGISDSADPFTKSYGGDFDIFVEDVNKLEYPGSSCDFQTRPLCQNMWSDPTCDVEGFKESRRGAGIKKFGKKAMTDFTTSTGIELLLRGHEAVLSGYKQQIPNVFTIFTAANYGATESTGAFAQMIIPTEDSSDVGAKKYSLKFYVHEQMKWDDFPTAKTENAVTPEEYQSLLEQRRSVVSVARSMVQQRMTTPNPDIIDCRTVSASVKAQLQEEVSEIIKEAGEAAKEGGRRKEVQEVMKDLDELEEAAPLEGTEQRGKAECEISLVGDAVEKTLLDSGVITPDEDQGLKDQVAMKMEVLKSLDKTKDSSTDNKMA